MTAKSINEILTYFTIKPFQKLRETAVMFRVPLNKSGTLWSMVNKAKVEFDNIHTWISNSQYNLYMIVEVVPNSIKKNDILWCDLSRRNYNDVIDRAQHEDDDINEKISILGA